MINPPRKPRQYPPPAPIQHTRILLVEGDTPLHFFEAFLKEIGRDSEIEVHDFRGNQDLPRFLKTLAQTPGFPSVSSVGIVRDAEQQAVQQVDASLRHAVAAASFPASVRVAWFIVPDNSKQGMLETLWMDAIRAEPSLAPVHACIDAFFQCLGQNNVAIPAGIALAKHEVQVFLATRAEAQIPPGIAATKGFLPWSSQAFVPLRSFLASL